MDFSLSEEQRILKNTAREFLEKECPKSLVRELAGDESGYSAELWRKIAELGWTGLIFAQRYGGMDGSLLDLILLLEEMGRALLPSPFFPTVVLGGLTILEAGSEKIKERLLPQICQGDLFLTLALTETEDHYSPEGIKTSALQQGQDYVLQGTKLFVPYAHLAQKIICVARIEAEGITLFLLDSPSEGLIQTPLKTLAGDKQSELLFRQVRATADQILGEKGQGWTYMERVLPKATIAKCAEMVGGAGQVLDMTIQYAKERHQFGRPIGSFQIIQHYCADMLCEVEACRHLTYQAAWMLSEGLPAKKEVAIAKAWCSEAFKKITKMAHQIHGAIGFTEEHDLHLFYKQAKTAELIFGDAYWHRRIVAQEMGI